MYLEAESLVTKNRFKKILNKRNIHLTLIDQHLQLPDLDKYLRICYGQKKLDKSIINEINNCSDNRCRYYICGNT